VSRHPITSTFEVTHTYDVEPFGPEATRLVVPGWDAPEPVALTTVSVVWYSQTDDPEMHFYGRRFYKSGGLRMREQPILIPLGWTDKVDLCKRLGIDLTCPMVDRP
jgi:hypothetical protein